MGFLAAFVALSIATMTAVAALWGRALGAAFPRSHETVAGVLGIAVGASLVAEHVVAIGLL